MVDSEFIFFFFKQKTAYEMCGRDWSSDVCSSDLRRTVEEIRDRNVEHERNLMKPACADPVCAPLILQIGRASCRERV